MKPLVSVVLPIYNAESYLDQALDSVTGQTLRGIEIVCVNDGSTDGSLGILERHRSCDDRIRIVDVPNGGYGRAMNIGIDHATGDYVGIVEPDDYILPAMYETLYNRAAPERLDFVRSDFYRFVADEGKGEHRWLERICPRSTYYGAVLDPQLNHCLFREVQMQNWTGIYRMDFVREHAIRFHESPGASFQDNSFWFQTYCWATRVAYVDEPFYCHRNDNPASSTNQPDKAFAMLDEYAWIRSWLGKHPELEARYATLLQYKKTHNAMFAFSKLADGLQDAFLARYAQESRDAVASGEVDPSLFWDEEWEQFQAIMSDPAAYGKAHRRARREQAPGAGEPARPRSFLSSLKARVLGA